MPEIVKSKDGLAATGPHCSTETITDLFRVQRDHTPLNGESDFLANFWRENYDTI